MSLLADSHGHGGHGGGQAGEAEPSVATSQCLGWIEETYGIGPLLSRLQLDLEERYEVLRSCVARDTARMSPDNAVRFCDNVFKVHCSALGLLTEVGEAIVEECEARLAESLGKPVGDTREWRTCAERAVFDRYVLKGEVSDEAACRAILVDECGADLGPEKEAAAWRTWGGPEQNFKAPAASLATAWPESGPTTLWSRSLGEGYSAILYERGRLYTMYRSGSQEAVICLDAASGATVWEQRYPQPPHEKHLRTYGDGPNSTPLIAGDRVFTVGTAGTLNALDKKTGELAWSRELWGDEMGGNFLLHGYSSSPMAYRDMVIVPVGGKKSGVVAFDQATGDFVWKTPAMGNSYSSARLMKIGGVEQLVVMMAEQIIGIDPATGELLWSHPHANQWKTNVTLPVLAGGDTIFLSSPEAGARGLQLTVSGAGWHVEEVWSSRRIQFYHVSSAQDGDWVYGSSGTTSPAFLSAVNIRTGEIGWRERGFAKANVVAADGKLVILDEDGMLYLARARPESLEVLARTQLLSRVAWTVPTLVGTTLYARDRGGILAVDLG